MRFGWLLACAPTLAFADAPVVEAVTVSGDVVSVTISHPDTGWDHYADKWDIVGPDGTVYGTRRLLHPHEHEQPFTRSLSGVEIPEGVKKVIVRAHDNVHKYGGAEFTVMLPA